MTTAKPLDAGGWFVIHNYVFDVAMRELSPNSWKVLCWSIRQTWGWADPATDSGRKEADQISYSQFMQGTGIKGRGTLAAALQECLRKGYLVRREVGRDKRSGNPLFAYALNTEYKVSGTETVPLSSTETVPTKEKKEKKETAAAVLTGEQQAALDLLLTVPRMDPATARRMVRRCELAHVAGWVAEGLQAPEEIAAPLVIRRLLDHEPPPEARGGDGRPRFVGGAICGKCWQSPCVCFVQAHRVTIHDKT
jgi:hypothetical protein